MAGVPCVSFPCVFISAKLWYKDEIYSPLEDLKIEKEHTVSISFKEVYLNKCTDEMAKGWQ